MENLLNNVQTEGKQNMRDQTRTGGYRERQVENLERVRGELAVTGGMGLVLLVFVLLGHRTAQKYETSRLG